MVEAPAVIGLHVYFGRFSRLIKLEYKGFGATFRPAALRRPIDGAVEPEDLIFSVFNDDHSRALVVAYFVELAALKFVVFPVE